MSAPSSGSVGRSRLTPKPLGPGEQRDRRRSRGWALQVHYLWESGGSEGTLESALEETARTRRIAERRLSFLRRLLTTLDEHLATIDETLQGAVEHWRLERLASIDRGILRIAVTELLFLDDVPEKVSILEAVRLAEAYGGNESPRFVNGVLHALYKRDSTDG